MGLRGQKHTYIVLYSVVSSLIIYPKLEKANQSDYGGKRL